MHHRRFVSSAFARASVTGLRRLRVEAMAAAVAMAAVACGPGDGLAPGDKAGGVEADGGQVLGPRDEDGGHETDGSQPTDGAGSTDTVAEVDASTARAACDPCNASDECGAEAGCAGSGTPAGADGWFCAPRCGPGGTCAPGTTCQTAASVEGAAGDYCLPADGACDCSAAARAAGWSTACSQTAKGTDGATIGTCAGTRTCTAEGLSACSAATPAAETCNGQDDDCDGQTDDAAPGTSLCDDGNPCTEVDSCVAGACSSSASDCVCQQDADCAAQEDGNACNGTLVCDTTASPYTCKIKPGSIVQCDAALTTACTTGTCDPATGQCAAKPSNEGAGCNADDSLCTQGDTCQAGACTPGAAVVCDDGNPCTSDSCDAAKGCVHAPNTAPCDADGNACTENDQCQCVPGAPGGATCQCVPGAAKACQDANPCTLDGCDAATGACTHVGAPLDGQPCSLGTGDACTSGASCQAGQCQAGQAKGCDDGNPCTTDGCDPKTGCTAAPNTAPCDDGNACTGSDQCAAGQCQGGANVCDCQTDADCAAKAGGDKCQAKLVCDKAKFVCAEVPGTAVVCDAAAGSACAANVCDPATGSCKLQPINDGKACDADGSVCTVGDLCQGGACKPGAAAACDDGNPCTNDACDAKAGCTHVANLAPCDADGNACTVGDACKDKACVAGAAKVCTDANPCTADGCDAKTGSCTHLGAPVDGQPCDADGSVCTVGDKCQDGTCQAGAALGCDDGNPCTIDGCDKQVPGGCTHVANALPCNADGNACTADACKDKACVPGPAKACDDGNACTSDGCDAKTGSCTHDAAAQNGKACAGAGTACTGPATCQAGTCQPGPSIACDDGDPCTKDACDVKTGCTHVAQACGGGKVQAAWGGAYHDDLAAVVAVSGGYVAAGQTTSFGQGQGDALLVKVSGCGDVVWQRTFGGTGKDGAAALAQAADGGFVLAGQSSSWNASGDAYVVRTDEAGNEVWSYTHGGTGFDLAQSVVATADGGFVVVAKTYSFGPGTPALHNGLLFKLDSGGKLLWSRVYGGADGSMDSVMAREVKDAAGNWNGLLVIGGSEGYGQGWDDIWLMKLKADGTHEWSFAWGGPLDDDPTTFVQAADGSFYVAGITKGWGAAKTDVFVAKVSLAGEVVWFKRYGGAGKDEAAGIALRGGNLLVTGMTTSWGLGLGDAFVLELDPGGGVVGLRTYGGAGEDLATAVVATADGGLALVGRTASAGKGGNDAWLVKADGTGSSGCGEKAVDKSQVNTGTYTLSKEAFTPVLSNAGSQGAEDGKQGAPTLAKTGICACQ